MKTLNWLASASLAVVMLSGLYAEPHCPGNVASIRPRFFARSLIAVPVMLDNSGPYDFVLDTGTEITTIDPALASEVHPKLLGATLVTGVGFHSQADYAQIKLLQAGTHSIKDLLVLVEDIRQIQHTDPRIRGILGENFLERFDLLIDYRQRIVCLDETKQMQPNVNGERIALLPPHPAGQYLPFTLPLIVPAKVSGLGRAQLRLQLDSGSDAPCLFEYDGWLPRAMYVGSPQHSRTQEEIVQAISVLPRQDVRVGGHSFLQIPFVTPVDGGKDIRVKHDVDGVLPTALFHSAFISYADHFAVLE